MRLVLGCPINLAFGGFPRWGGRSYHGSVERGVCNLQWEGTATLRACGLREDPEEVIWDRATDSQWREGSQGWGKALVVRKRKRFLLFALSSFSVPRSWLWPTNAVCRPQENPPCMFWGVEVATDPRTGLRRD